MLVRLVCCLNKSNAPDIHCHLNSFSLIGIIVLAAIVMCGVAPAMQTSKRVELLVSMHPTTFRGSLSISTLCVVELLVELTNALAVVIPPDGFRQQPTHVQFYELGHASLLLFGDRECIGHYNRLDLIAVVKLA